MSRVFNQRVRRQMFVCITFTEEEVVTPLYSAEQWEKNMHEYFKQWKFVSDVEVLMLNEQGPAT